MSRHRSNDFIDPQGHPDSPQQAPRLGPKRLPESRTPQSRPPRSAPPQSGAFEPGAALPLAAAAATLAARLPHLALAAETLSHQLATGLHGQRKPGSGEAFWQYRPFESGDPAADIDWRQSARSEHRLFVRETEWESAVTLWVWCDITPSMHYASRPDLATKAERAAIISTAIILTALKADETVRLLTPVPYRLSGQQDAAGIIEKLFESLPPDNVDRPDNTGRPEKAGRPERAGRPAPLPVFPPEAKNHHCLLLSDFYTPIDQIGTSLSQAAAMGMKGHLVQIMDPAELDFPFRGRIRFRAPDENASRLFGEASEVAAAYKAAAEHHHDAIEKHCRDIGWHHTRHQTGEPAITAALPVMYRMTEKHGGEHP